MEISEFVFLTQPIPEVKTGEAKGDCDKIFSELVRGSFGEVYAVSLMIFLF